jgi:hypothetical protein
MTCFMRIFDEPSRPVSICNAYRLLLTAGNC